MLGLDLLVAGDVEWYADRVDPEAPPDATALHACVEGAAALDLDRDALVALWLGAALHDCGMVFHRGHTSTSRTAIVMSRAVFDALCPPEYRDLGDSHCDTTTTSRMCSSGRCLPRRQPARSTRFRASSARSDTQHWVASRSPVPRASESGDSPRSASRSSMRASTATHSPIEGRRRGSPVSAHPIPSARRSVTTSASPRVPTRSTSSTRSVSTAGITAPRRSTTTAVARGAGRAQPRVEGRSRRAARVVPAAADAARIETALSGQRIAVVGA